MNHWPQYLAITLMLLTWLGHCERAGMPYDDVHSATKATIAAALWIAILFFGGFFAPIGWAP